MRVWKVIGRAPRPQGLPLPRRLRRRRGHRWGAGGGGVADRIPYRQYRRCPMGPHRALLLTIAALGASCTASPAVPGSDDGSADPALLRGRDIWGKACASCHASDGSGGRGPSLVSVELRFPLLVDQVAVVSDGRGAMPGFGGRYGSEELEAVVRYTREVL